jgi:hypothetical protein
MTNKVLKKRGAWVLGGVVVFLGLPAAATVIAGGGLKTGGTYYVQTPPDLANTPCFPTVDAISILTAPDNVSDMVEIRVNTRRALEDTNANTFLRCTMIGDPDGRSNMMCYVGHPDGKVSYCRDSDAPNHLPTLDDRVYITIDTVVPVGTTDNCEVYFEKSFGEAIPACRTSTTSTANDCYLPAYTPGASYTSGVSKVTNVCTSGEIGQVSGCVPGKKEVFQCMAVDPYYCNSLSPGVSSGWWSAWQVLSQCN